MIKEIMICDVCNEEIPKVKKKDVFGIEREYYRLGEINVDESYSHIKLHELLGVHTCERCAAKMSQDMLKWKYDVLLKNKR